MSVTVRTDRFERCQGEPDKGGLLATCRGEKTHRAPSSEVLMESGRATRILGRLGGDTLCVGGEAALCHSIVDCIPREIFVTMFNAIHKYEQR